MHRKIPNPTPANTSISRTNQPLHLAARIRTPCLYETITSINKGPLTGALSNLLKEPLFTNQRSLTFNARMGPPNPLPRGSLLSGRLSSASSDPSLSASSWSFWTSLREKRVLDGKTSFQRLGCFKGFRGCSFQCTEKRSNEEFRKHSPAVGLTVLQAKWQS